MVSGSPDRPRLAVCSSVHSEWDPRVAYREAAALAEHFDVHLYVNDTGRSVSDAGPALWTVHKFERPGNRLRRAMSGRRLVRQAVDDGAQAVIVHDPEMLPWLVLVAGRRAVKVYDVHEDYLSMVRQKSWLPALFRPFAGGAVRLAEKVFCRRVDVVIVADRHLESVFSAFGPVLVRNYPPAKLFEPGKPAGSRPHVIAYVGGITPERGAAEMLEVLREVRETVPAVELHVIGRVPHGDAEGRMLAEPGVRLLGEVAYPRIGEEIARARVGLALIRDTPKHRRNVPSKLFDYMACGTPWVATDLPNIREATQSRGGVFVGAQDVHAAASAVLRVLVEDDTANELGSDGVRAVSESFSFEAEARRLLARLTEATASASGAAASRGPVA